MPRLKAVCDSSPLITFAKVRRLHLLLSIFGTPLLIPREVYVEAVEMGLEKKEHDAVLIKACIKNNSILVKKARKIIVFPFLGAGENAVISLALENKAEIVCVDEAPARNAARRLGLKPVGSLGVLFLAVQNKLVSKQDALDLLDEMIKRDYRISAKILEKFRKALDK